MDKVALFFQNASLLNKRFGVVPLMYGSLGLEYITGENLNSDDIDILIPKVYIRERWNELVAFLTSEGYALIDEHEHTFEKDGEYYSYGFIEDLVRFAGIRMGEIAQKCDNGVCFSVLSLPQYLRVYTASAKDGYRVNVRNKKDNDKIIFIKKRLDKDYS